MQSYREEKKKIQDGLIEGFVQTKWVEGVVQADRWISTFSLQAFETFSERLTGLEGTHSILFQTPKKRPQPIDNPSTAPSCQEKLTELQESRKAHLGDMSDVLEKRDNLCIIVTKYTIYVSLYLSIYLSIYLTSPHLTSPHLTSPHLTSPHLTSPHLTSPNLT